MEHNLLIEQYSRYKKMELESSPFHFLLNAHIEINPHQINAFCAAINALKTGGIILADEVGLGKTIEAGLVLKYVLEQGAKRVLIVLPASLRKQWEIELDEKFDIQASILDRYTIEREKVHWNNRFINSNNVEVIIASYDFSSKLIAKYPKVKWDFVIIDEAHNLRNVFSGTKRAKRLYDLTVGIPKILLTATPLQNSLEDLHGLVSFIDPRIFGDKRCFEKRYVIGENYSELKKELSPVLYRTLRKDVAKYMNFKKRICKTVDFVLYPDEVELYQRVNDFLKREVLYSIPTSNKRLITLVIRKLLASSSFAVVETFEILRKRLAKLYEGTKSADAQEGFNLFMSFVEDEYEETDVNDKDDEIVIQKAYIQEEIDEVDTIISVAKRITTNAKISALKQAITIAFDYQDANTIPKKVLVFTESRRTQEYIARELRKSGFEKEDIVLFSGSFDDEISKEIYKAWMVKNYGKVNHGLSVEYKNAIVDYFKNNGKILICTDAGSEGLNLQFCNTVINYDLPWNPMKIEQRIGRCHRYGQEHDVVAINLLNTQNAADRRVYEILSRKFELFEGVFGASDIALGALESGSSFEKMVLYIYQSCNTTTEFKRAFDKLDKRFDSNKDKKARALRSLLIAESSEAKEKSLDSTKREIDQYLSDVEFWNDVDDSDTDGSLQYWRVDDWGEATLGSHGTLFLGAFCDSGKMLFPVLLLCDNNGEYIHFEEKDLVAAIEQIDDRKIRYYKPSKDDESLYQSIYNRLVEEMTKRYQKQVERIKEYNRTKIDNWERIRIEQLTYKIQDMKTEIDVIRLRERLSNNFLEKVDIRKEIEQRTHQLEKFQLSFHDEEARIKEEGIREIAEFDKKFEITPVLRVNVVLKF